MTLRCKRPRPLSREDHPLRDARLYIIATEDTHAPQNYFLLFKNPRIKIHVLPTEDSRSAPVHVIRRLDAFRSQYELMEDDQLWLMLDTDHWTEANHVATFEAVCREAIQKRYKLAHSNPCFEVWLLMHFSALNGMEFRRCEDVILRLREQLGTYSKRTIRREYFTPSTIRDAVSRAEAADENPDARWPPAPGSHVYKLVRDFL